MAPIWHVLSPVGSRFGSPRSRERSEAGWRSQVPHRFRPWKAEHLPGAGLRIASVGEAREHAGAFVNEWQGLAIIHPLELGGRVTPGLLLDRRDLLAPIFRLGLDHADGFLADEENVVGGAVIRPVFANGYPEAGAEVDLLVVLNHPACLRQHLVDTVPRRFFGCPVGTRHRFTRPLRLARCSSQGRPQASSLCLSTYARMNSRSTWAAGLSCAWQIR